MLLAEHDAKTKMVPLQRNSSEAGIDKFEIEKSKCSFADVQAVKCWACALENHLVVASGARDFLDDSVNTEITNGVITTKGTWGQI